VISKSTYSPSPAGGESEGAGAVANSLFIRAAFSQPVERPPVWMMRQAGRFMKEYWDIKNKYSFLDMCKTPELASAVTRISEKRMAASMSSSSTGNMVTSAASSGVLHKVLDRGFRIRYAGRQT